MDSVPELADLGQAEATFPDGAKLGSGHASPPHRLARSGGEMSNPGHSYIIAEGSEINAGRPTRALSLRNTGDRAIQVDSHFHFFEVNRALAFDRAAARFEPGDRKDVALAAIGGVRRVGGRNGLAGGSLDAPETRRQPLELAVRHGFSRPVAAPNPKAAGVIMARISRRQCAELCGRASSPPWARRATPALWTVSIPSSLSPPARQSSPARSQRHARRG